MKFARMLLVCSACNGAGCMAQKWEVGGGVGGGFYTSEDVTSPGDSASAKIQTNIAGGGMARQHWLGPLGRGDSFRLSASATWR